jgi:hypothetical protein
MGNSISDSESKALTARFDRLFDGLRRAFGQYLVPPGTRADDRGKIEGKAETWSRRLLELADWEAHLSGERGLGIVPIRDDDTCLFGAIDIDIYPVDHRDILELCRQYDIPLILCRSKSGGIHGYVFFSEPVPARLLRQRLTVWARLIGHGGCEVFPKQDRMTEEACGNWINLPFFGGERSLRYAFGDDGKAVTPEEFLDTAEASRKPLEWLKGWKAPEVQEATAAAPGEPGEGSGGKAGGIRFDDEGDWHGAPPCLEALAANRRIPDGMRNQWLFNTSGYLRRRYGKGNWRDIARRYNDKFCDPAVKADELKTMFQSVDRDYGYTCHQEPLHSACNRSLCLRRKYGIKRQDPRCWDETAFTEVQELVGDGESTWRATINGRPLTFNGKDLTLQWLFLVKLKSAGLYLERVKEPEFTGFVRAVFGDAEKVEPIRLPEGGTMVDEIRDLLATMFEYRSKTFETNPPVNREGLLARKAVMEGDRLLVCATDLIKELRREKIAISKNDLLRTVHDLGVKVEQMMVKGKTLDVWSFPSPSIQTEPFTARRLPKEEPF